MVRARVMRAHDVAVLRASTLATVLNLGVHKLARDKATGEKGRDLLRPSRCGAQLQTVIRASLQRAQR